VRAQDSVWRARYRRSVWCDERADRSFRRATLRPLLGTRQLTPAQLDEYVSLFPPGREEGIRGAHARGVRTLRLRERAEGGYHTDAEMRELLTLDPAREADVLRYEAARRGRLERERREAEEQEQRERQRQARLREAIAAGADPAVAVFACHLILARALEPFVRRQFAACYGAGLGATAFAQAAEEAGAEGQADLLALTRMILDQWDGVFAAPLTRRGGVGRAAVDAVRRDRNELAHRPAAAPYSAERALEAVDHVRALLAAIGAGDMLPAVEAQRRTIRLFE